MDEATSNVDWKTDNFIKNCIWTHFKDCTIITIAHRLDTIKDYDKIIVMEKGRVKEEGNYDELLVNTDSYFYSLHQY